MRTVSLAELDADEALRRRLRGARRVVCVVGAGLSTSSGIPDFRSAGGLYEQVKGKYGVRHGADLFDANLFRRPDSTKMFHEFTGKLYELTAKATPTAGHHFLSHLRDGRRLVRVYTQNIDGLEEEAGLRLHALDGGPEGEVVQLHGDLRWLRCGLCHAKFPIEPHQASYQRGEPVACPDCKRTAAERERLGKRALGEGVLRSAIVLYNEEHPHGIALATLAMKDMRRRPDCLVIMGTSLKVAGCKRLVRDMAKAVHSHPRGGLVLFVNATDVSESEWANVIDVHVRGGIDEVAQWLETVMPKVAPPKPRIPGAVRKVVNAKGQVPDADTDVEADSDEWEDLPASSAQVVPDTEPALAAGGGRAYRMDLPTTPRASQGSAPSSPSKLTTVPLSPRRSPRATPVAAVPRSPPRTAATPPPLSPRRTPRKAAVPTTPTAATTATAMPAAGTSPTSDARKRHRATEATRTPAATTTPSVQRKLTFTPTATTTMQPLNQLFSQRKAGLPSPSAKSPHAKFKSPSPAHRPTPVVATSSGASSSPRVSKSLGYTGRRPATAAAAVTATKK